MAAPIAREKRCACGQVSRRSCIRGVTLEDVARITAEQTAEPAWFVDQCSPGVLRQILSMLA